MTKTADGSLLLDFANAGTGLVSKDNAATLSGFAVAGKDGKFYPAEAIIVGKNQVKVKNNLVTNPVDVRYLWVNSGDMNLFIKKAFRHFPSVQTSIG